MTYSTGKSFYSNEAMTDAYGHVVREGDEVMLLNSSIKQSRYVIDEINSHIAYLRPLNGSQVTPFPVLSDQIMKVKRRQTRASNTISQ